MLRSILFSFVRRQDVCWLLFACRFVSLRLTGWECKILFSGDICDWNDYVTAATALNVFFFLAMAAVDNNMPNSINTVCGFSFFSSQVFPKAQDNINRMLLEVLARTKC